MIPDGAAALGLDGPIPPGRPGHKVDGIATELREFPARYVSPEVHTFMRLWRMHDQGLPLLDGGVLHWPARLVRALDFIGREVTARRAHHG